MAAVEPKKSSDHVFESFLEPLLELTSELIVLDANAAFFEHFKLEPQETLGRSIYEIGCGQWDNPALRTLLGRLIREKKPFSGFQLDQVLQGLGRRVMLLCGCCMQKPGVVLLSFHDITERHASEQRKDDYLAMLGHELRNPLGAIRSATEVLMRSDSRDARSRRACGVMARQAEQMAKIIDDLLDVSRIARGKIHLKRGPVLLRDVICDVMEVRLKHLSNRGLEYQIEFPDEVLWVWGDQARLVQVVDNLVGNAIKFTEAPGRVSVRLERDSQGYAAIRVRDTGVGIRPEILPGIFEPFCQDNQRIGRATGGLGLGLSLCRGLVQLHRGTLEARSEGVGHGAEFVVRLRLIAPPANFAQPSERPLEENERILLVEDNADVAAVFAELLEMAGHEVLIAPTASGALRALRESMFDVVLCDLGLPDMRGHDLARTIRTELGLQETLLIAVTGYGQASDMKLSEQAGFDAHLTKPVNVTTVHDTLARLRH